MRVGLLIYSQKQIESFISSGFLKNIQSNYSTSVLLNDAKLMRLISINKNPSQLKSLNVLFRKMSTYIQCLELWRAKDISFAHQVRAFNQFGKKKEREKWTSVIVYEMENWSDFRRFLLRFLSHAPFFHSIKFIECVARRFYVLNKWKSEISQYDVLLIPFAGHTSHVWGNAVWVCKKLGVRTVALQENWDNVSSKTVITDKPDLFAVWGAQSKNHLTNIHGLSESEIVVVGSPRFDQYFNEGFQTPIASNPNGDNIVLTSKDFILLAGTGDGIDDRMLINETFKAIASLTKPPLVVYRPHPFTRYEHDLEDLVKVFPEIILDSGPNARKFGHQIPLVRNAAMIINHFSTLTLEGLIAKRFVCIPLFLGRPAKITYDRFLDSAPHYVGFSLIQNLLTPRNQQEFRDAILHALQNNHIELGGNFEWACKSAYYPIEIKSILHSLKKF